jgi:hypothetical protein
MIHAFITWRELWDVTDGEGYQWWSGVGSDLGQVTLITGLIVGFWRVRKHLECHVESPKNCHRIGRPVAGTGHRACRLHHPNATEKGAITEDTIRWHHERGSHEEEA